VIKGLPSSRSLSDPTSHPGDEIALLSQSGREWVAWLSVEELNVVNESAVFVDPRSGNSQAATRLDQVLAESPEDGLDGSPIRRRYLYQRCERVRAFGQQPDDAPLATAGDAGGIEEPANIGNRPCLCGG
jgi:hypothetical protein